MAKSYGFNLDASALGRGMRKAKGGWKDNYIRRILTTRLVLGEWQPCRLSEGRYSASVPAGEVIPNYFPQIVTTELWHAAQARNTKHKVVKGRPGINLLTKLVFDKNQAPMHVEIKSKADGGGPYLATNVSYRRQGVPYARWNLNHVETCILKFMREIDWVRVFTDDSREPELRRLHGRLGEIEHELQSIQTKSEHIAKTFLEGLGVVGDAIKQQGELLTQQHARLNDERSKILRQIDELEASSRIDPVDTSLMQTPTPDLKDPKIRQRLRHEILRLIQRITLFPDGQIPGFEISRLQKKAAKLLRKNRGNLAVKTGRICGAIHIETISGKDLIIWVTYRPCAKKLENPVVLGVHGVGYVGEEWLTMLREE